MKTIEIDPTSVAQSRSQLIDAATTLFFKYGIKSISMDDIAKKMGISKKTIYNIINTKSELIKASISSVIEEEHNEIENISATAINAIDEMVLIARQSIKTLNTIKPTLMYDLQKYHKHIWQLVEDEHLSYVGHIIEENVRRGLNEGFYRNDIQPPIIARLYLGLAAQVITVENNTSNTMGHLSEIYESMILYHLHGIMNDQGKKEFIKYQKKQPL